MGSEGREPENELEELHLWGMQSHLFYTSACIDEL
jgi:hypothetical protein